MSLTIIEPGKQQYTLLCQQPNTKQRYICTIAGTPVLTTDLDALIEYTRTLVCVFPECIYSIAMVTDMQEVNAGLDASVM